MQLIHGMTLFIIPTIEYFVSNYIRIVEVAEWIIVISVWLNKQYCSQ